MPCKMVGVAFLLVWFKFYLLKNIYVYAHRHTDGWQIKGKNQHEVSHTGSLGKVLGHYEPPE